MKGILTSLFENESLKDNLALELNIPFHALKMHQFPDEEVCLTADFPCQENDIFLLTSLDRPNPKVLPLLFASQTLKQQGARSVYLITPYLPYMRQDKAFHPGEGISAQYFAKIISSHFDGLVTIDPHLHRYPSLEPLYRIPTKVLKAAPLVAKWISQNITNPLLIGPDAESEQWIKAVATLEDMPYITLEKIRSGDKNVKIQMKDLSKWAGKSPVLVDDIISSGHTIIETCKQLMENGFNQPSVIATHGIFADNAYEKLKPFCSRVITTNTITHSSNQIDISPLLSKGITEIFK